MIPVCQKATRYTNKSVPTGPTSVPNVKCAKVNHTYQNSLVIMPSVLNTADISLVYQNATGAPNVTTVTDVPKMTKNDPCVPVFGSMHFHIGF